MPDPFGFMRHPRELPPRRPVLERIHDNLEIDLRLSESRYRAQATRCMDCGVAFCQRMCPLGIDVPRFLDAVYAGQWRLASDVIHATNNFPEFTGRLCSAFCEASCVLGINADPVAIKMVAKEVIDRAWDEGWVVPQPPRALEGQNS
jgi:glutamate synthase (NADPH/NADH) small chain